MRTGVLAACMHGSSAYGGGFHIFPFLGAQLEVGGGNVLFQVRHLRSSRNRKHHRRALQKPGDGELGHGGRMLGCDFGESRGRGVIRLQELSPGNRVPGQESHPLPLTVEKGFLATTVGETVSILDSGDFDQLPTFVDLLDRNFAETDVADLALLLHAAECAERLFQRGARVDAVELVEGNAIELEAAQAHFDALHQVAGAADVFRARRALASDAAFGGDDQVARIGVQRLADHALGHFRTVGVSGGDGSNPKLDGAEKHAAGFGGIFGLSPGAFAHQAHGAVAEAADRDVAPDGERAAGGGRRDWIHREFVFYVRIVATPENARCNLTWNPAWVGCVFLRASANPKGKRRRQPRRRHNEHRSVPQSAGNLLSAIRGRAPRRSGWHSAGAVPGNLRGSPLLFAADWAGDSLRVLLLDGDYVDSGRDRVLLHAGARARVQRDSSGGDCRGAGDSDAGMGPAGECDGEYAGRGGRSGDTAGNAAGLRTVQADQSAGGAVLRGVRRDAVNGSKRS